VLTDCGVRATAIADLIESVECYLVEHRDCAGLAGSILEVTTNGARWGVAWLRCPACGLRWERHLGLNGAS
jgi:hypothetical protein